MKRAAKKQNVIDEISSAFEDAVDRAEELLSRGWEAAMDAMPREAEKTIDDWTKQTRKLSRDLDKQRKQVVKRVEKTIADLDKRRARLEKQAEKRIDGIVGSVERSVGDAVRPVAKRLDLASSSEVTSLKRRMTQLEKQVGAKKTTRRTTRKTARKTTRKAA